MITELITQWEANKHKLEEYFRTKPQSEYSEYKDIVIKLFELCIPESKYGSGWKLDRMTVIDDGDYQGTLIFLIPASVYQPDIEDYIVLHNYYGSCSGCDTLQAISNYDDVLPNEGQVKGYMTLAMHLVQQAKWLDS